MIRLSQLDLSKIKPTSRDEHISQIKQWQEAQRKLEALCAEKGIPVPVMVC